MENNERMIVPEQSPNMPSMNNDVMAQLDNINQGTIAIEASRAIAKVMGWNINKEKTVEVRKNYPKADDWNRIVKIYCSKNEKSFARIPKEYQPLMQQFLGKVVGEFVCDKIDYWQYNYMPGVMHIENMSSLSCVPVTELLEYLGQRVDMNGFDKILYAWHISDLVIYDKPKELSEFIRPCIHGESDVSCFLCDKSGYTPDMHIDCFNTVTRPPQSWCYVEVLK